MKKFISSETRRIQSSNLHLFPSFSVILLYFYTIPCPIFLFAVIIDFFLLFTALPFFSVHHFYFSFFPHFYLQMLFFKVIFLIVCLSATFQLFSWFSLYSLHLDFYFFFSFLTFISPFHSTLFYSILSFFLSLFILPFSTSYILLKVVFSNIFSSFVCFISIISIP